MHNPRLPIPIRVRLRVQLVQQARLLARRLTTSMLTHLILLQPVPIHTTHSMTLIRVTYTTTLILRQRRPAPRALSSNRGSNGLGLTCELISALVATGEVATLPLELVHGDSGESGGGMVTCFVVVDFVHGDGGVDD